MTIPNKIIDSHVHFWDNAQARITWVNDLPILNRPYHPPDLLVTAGDSTTIDKLIFVQADVAAEDSLREVAWVSALAAQYPQIAGIVAFAPLENPHAAREALNQLKDYPLVKGVRRLIQSEAAGFARDVDFIDGVRLLAEYDYTFDICIRHHQLEDVLFLVERCPDVRFVLDHIGKPDIKAGLLEPWKTHITALAAYDRVWCKLSGLVTEADADAWTPEDLAPYVGHILDSFGADRVMFGSDWPVVRLASTYTRWLETLTDLTGHLDPTALHKLFYANAAAFYGA